MTGWNSVVRFRLRLSLLEDLHVGTGMGGGEIDATQAVDYDHDPVIPWTHLKGVLRDSAERLNDLGRPNGAGIRLLFGWNSHRNDPAPERGTLVLTNAYLDKPLSKRRRAGIMRWISAAREELSRKPREDFMRIEEFVPAGTVFLADGELPRGLLDEFKVIVAATSQLGADRTRGGGLVELALEEVSLATSSAQLDDQPTSCLRVLLYNLDPLAFPRTANAGNIVESEAFIPGSALFGALVAWQHRAADQTYAERLLAERDVFVTNAYPLPRDVEPGKLDLKSVEVLPIPLNYHSKKSSASDTAFPWWAESAEKRKYLGGEHDRLAERPGEQSDTKRPGDAVFIARLGPGERYRRYDAPLARRMRIAVPDDGLRANQRLFTSEEIPERTVFVADVRFRNREQAKAFGEKFHAILSGSAFLRLGRAGRPITVRPAPVWIDEPAPSAITGELKDGVETARIVLASDLIVRGPKLGFVTRFDRSALERLTECSLGKNDGGGCDVKVLAHSDVATVRTFNASSGLPRAPAYAIRRGSCVQLCAASDEGKGCIRALVERLASERAWGERRHEGFGRMRVYVGDDPLTLSKAFMSGADPGTRSGSPSAGRSADELEAMSREGRKLVTKGGALYVKLSKTAWQSLASIAESAPEGSFQADLKKQLGHLAKRLAKGKDDQKTEAALDSERVLRALGVANGSPGSNKVAKARRLLGLACRWAIAEGLVKEKN
jgi:CRISPR/Cas system CMR subunit Cmr4 (Cas7 group RAMP superfamily)